MKLSIFAAAIGISTAAATSMCWTNTIIDATTASSPLVVDCQALADKPNILPDTWIPTEENNNSFDTSSGTCGVRGVLNAAGSNLAASQMTIPPFLVSGTIENVISTNAVDGRVGANGTFACMIPGRVVEIGWVDWEIYKVTSSQRRAHAKTRLE